MNDYVYLIVAPSGTGKTAVSEYLGDKYGLTTIESYTTRQPRYEGEKGHIFVSKEEFDKLKDMVAYTYFDEHEYCATAEQIDNNTFYVVDPSGIEYFEKNYKGHKIPVIIHLYASMVTRLQRMRGRGDSSAQLIQRVQNDTVKFINLKYDIRIDTENKTVEEVAEGIYRYIKQDIE